MNVEQVICPRCGAGLGPRYNNTQTTQGFTIACSCGHTFTILIAPWKPHICALCGEEFVVRRDHRGQFCMKCCQDPRALDYEPWRRALYYVGMRAKGELGPQISFQEWLTVLEDHDHKCAYCGRPYRQLGLFIGVEQGGSAVRANVIPVCGICKYSTHRVDYRQIDDLDSRIEAVRAYLLQFGDIARHVNSYMVYPATDWSGVWDFAGVGRSLEKQEQDNVL